MVSLHDAACGGPTCSDRAGNVTSTTAEAAPIWHAGHTYKGSIRSPSPRLASLFSHLPLPRLPPPLVFSYHFIGNRSGLPSRLVPLFPPAKDPVPPFFTRSEDSRELLLPSSLLHTDRQEKGTVLQQVNHEDKESDNVKVVVMAQDEDGGEEMAEPQQLRVPFGLHQRELWRPAAGDEEEELLRQRWQPSHQD
ncbi:uncharacterized protein LOC120667496 [Panicum virgatum]|uniref:uncharacterized protein LOC120667496 n=1 Tax=Panicum virgatum TaxID=38727 RepID=UPI0019D5233A|nr:uncharacterized protein LOC120667496 [Panicum virgatum]